MRAAEAQTTLAAASARGGDLDGAAELGSAALDDPRQSVPSLLMVTGDLVTELRHRYAHEPGTADYLDRIGDLAANQWLRALLLCPGLHVCAVPGHG